MKNSTITWKQEKKPTSYPYCNNFSETITAFSKNWSSEIIHENESYEFHPLGGVFAWTSSAATFSTDLEIDSHSILTLPASINSRKEQILDSQQKCNIKLEEQLRNQTYRRKEESWRNEITKSNGTLAIGSLWIKIWADLYFVF